MPAPKTPPVFTIGHSTRSIDAFVELLRAGNVDLVVDVRSIPRSRTNPKYNLDVLPGELAAFDIDHMRIAELGGFKGRAREVAAEVNAFWQNRSFHNYADHALSDDFRRGFRQLLDVSSERRTAIMCSEAVWWRCHRRIIADYLLLHGREVTHLMDGPRLEPARMTPAARPKNGSLVYPAEAED